VFLGTPEWAAPSLRALLASEIEVVAVVTNPDRAAGRGLQERASPVKTVALEAGIEVLQPSKLRDPDFRKRLEDLRADVGCVVAYGKILPAELLRGPPLGFVNAHFSLLPAYRGAAPVQWCLINGDSVTGISIMLLTEGMDEGPVLATQQVEIQPFESSGSLGARLATQAAPLLVDTIRSYAEGLAIPQPQAEIGVSYAPKLSADDVRIDWSRTAVEIHNLIRGSDPEPGAWTTFRGRRLKILNSAPAGNPEQRSPGRVEQVGGGLRVACGHGALSIERGQMEGKLPLSGVELARGLRLEPEDRLV
jgi:methionyl-tRNA formyltransferase